MKDILIKAMACDQHVRIYICSSTNLVEEARNRFDLWPTASAALGRTLTIASMMGSMLKDDKEQLTIMINGGGPIGTILVDAYPDGHVRGFVSEPHVHYQYNDTGKLAVGIAVGCEGTLEVTKHMSKTDNWRGIVELQSGEIAEDFARYFTESEQTPSAVSLGVLVDTDNHIISAGGFVIQMMPGATEEDIIKTEELLKTIQPMSTLIKDHDNIKDIVLSFYDDVQIIGEESIAFGCHCSEATMKRVLTTLTKEERLAMIEEDHGCEITCNFCNERYHFNEAQLRELEEFLDANAKH